MNKREKIIIGLMCMAVLYGVYELFLSPPAKGPATHFEAVTGPGASIEEVVKQVQDALAEETVTGVERYVIARAEANWKDDPFLAKEPEKKVPDGQGGPGSEQPETKVDIRYTGYIEMGKLRMAILNGQEYEAGEEIPPGGFILRQVEPDRVIVEAKADNRKVTIMLVEEKL